MKMKSLIRKKIRDIKEHLKKLFLLLLIKLLIFLIIGVMHSMKAQQGLNASGTTCRIVWCRMHGQMDC